MSIVTDAEILDFVGVTTLVFEVDASSDTLVMRYNGGGLTNVSIPDGTYSGDELAAAIETAIDSAFTISSTVSWSPTTYKFTITAPSGKTLAYVNSGSDAGYLIGFDDDKTAALTLTSDRALGDPSADVLDIRNGIEAFVEKFCRRIFSSATYTLERYSGTGSPYLSLKQKPVTSVEMVSIGTRDAMYVYNTTDYSYASVSVTSTGLILSRDGSTDATLTFASYATLTLLVDAINAVGSNWVAKLASSDYASFKSSFLIKRFGASAIDSNYVYLKIPNKPLYTFDVLEDRGVLYYPAGFPAGENNVFVTYTAGSAPDDIKMAIKIIVKNFYEKVAAGTFNLDSYRTGDLSVNYSTALVANAELMARAIPPEALSILQLYRKVIA